MSTLLEVIKLKLALDTKSGLHDILASVNFCIKEGQTFSLIGESGSGKSITALAILGLLPDNTLYGKESKILFQNLDLLNVDERNLCRYRGKEIAMIFQEPMTSLNPIQTVGDQISESITIHQKLSRKKLKEKVKTLLKEVNIQDVERVYHAYPHELSGGMRQRVMIAMAIALKPKLLIADEPTTALDVTTENEIIALLQKLQREFSMSILFITHNIKLASLISDEMAVMKNGHIIETGTPVNILNHPVHAYTKALIEALPKEQKNTPSKTINEILSVKNLNVQFPIKKGFFNRQVGVISPVQKVNFTLNEGETLCIVGESGSGKTTLAKAIVSLIKPAHGEVKILKQNLMTLTKEALRKKRSEFQMIFQDPFSALDPRFIIKDILQEGVVSLHANKMDDKQLDFLLSEVGLDPKFKWRFPHELSGGQRQRVCIARAIALKPKLLVLDEPTSSLDVSYSAKILDLLLQLQREFQLSYLFITHNMAIVKAMAHKVAVMKNGQIVEYGSTEEVLNHPKNPYTQQLLNTVYNYDTVTNANESVS